jgi:hypothetical protein
MTIVDLTYSWSFRRAALLPSYCQSGEGGSGYYPVWQSSSGAGEHGVSLLASGHTYPGSKIQGIWLPVGWRGESDRAPGTTRATVATTPWHFQSPASAQRLGLQTVRAPSTESKNGYLELFRKLHQAVMQMAGRDPGDCMACIEWKTSHCHIHNNFLLPVDL